jgi:hypothetical protein
MHGNKTLKGIFKLFHWFYIQVSKKTLSGARWLLFLNQNFSRIEDFFTEIYIPFDCEFLVVHKEHDCHFTLTEVYRVSPSLPLQTRRRRNLASLNNRNLYRRRDNLQGLVVRSVVHESVSVYCDANLEWSARQLQHSVAHLVEREWHSEHSGLLCSHLQRPNTHTAQQHVNYSTTDETSTEAKYWNAITMFGHEHSMFTHQNHVPHILIVMLYNYFYAFVGYYYCYVGSVLGILFDYVLWFTVFLRFTVCV